MSDPVLRITDLHAGYGDLGVLFGVSLTIDPGERHLVFGPNGSGKSTMLKAICGLADTTGGKVRGRTHDVTGAGPGDVVRRGIALVPQTDNVFPSLTVRENLRIGGVLAAEPGTRMQQVFDLFPLLADRRDQRAGSLSGGERQLVALGRALMLDPEVLLLDEPTAGLAPRTTEETLTHIRQINDTRGTTILLVEQNVLPATQVTEQFHLMEAGRITTSGPIEHLRSSPDLSRAYLGAAAAGRLHHDQT